MITIETRDLPEPKFASALKVSADTAADKAFLFRHYRLFENEPENMARTLLETESFHYVPAPGKNRAWYHVTVSLDLEWTAPFMNRMETLTGWRDDTLGSREPFMLPRPTRDPIMHTHIVMPETFRLEHGHFCAEVVVASQDWNGVDAATRADRLAIEYLQQDLGRVPPTPEFIPKGSVYVRNPEYPGRQKTRPGWGAYPDQGPKVVIQSLWDYWLRTHATEKQKAAWHERMGAKRDPRALLQDTGFYYRSEGGTVNWGGNEAVAYCSWEEFRTLT